MKQRPESYWICLKQSNGYNIQIFGLRHIFFEAFCISTIGKNCLSSGQEEVETSEGEGQKVGRLEE